MLEMSALGTQRTFIIESAQFLIILIPAQPAPESWAGLLQLAIDAQRGETTTPRNNAGKLITTALVSGLPQN